MVFSAPPVFTTYPDVTFEITKKNKKQVTIDGQTLNLGSMNDYTVIYRNGKPESTTHSLYYNKTTGTLSYYVSGHAGAGGNSYDRYTSY